MPLILWMMLRFLALSSYTEKFWKFKIVVIHAVPLE
jgi:hypothetical protein